MSWKSFSYAFTVLELDLDSFGHMNNATYLNYFEKARWELITLNGYGFKQVHELQQGPTILEIQLSFKKEIKLRDRVIIQSQVKDYDGKVGVLVQEMFFEGSSDLLCRAELKVALFDMKKRRLIEPTPLWRQAIGEEL